MYLNNTSLALHSYTYIITINNQLSSLFYRIIFTINVSI